MARQPELNFNVPHDQMVERVRRAITADRRHRDPNADEVTTDEAAAEQYRFRDRAMAARQP